ncbi:DUF1330 domain-containing protein [Roseomonas xinghualingensis]|uniref:DUF1330 domain-containing protein n=1 Tax=Roseomonas xinghualingensis TaxID=2986475 RepID=UPI0021F2478E|nr:DUF1330 domain-containing protein [Roseomonas sp. SXEYE001]MCV4208798.1 DUF1330 domain-containing protein [Roseomonas sp. SXEYE001]
MPAYAAAHLRQVSMGPEITEYLRRIDDTLRPHGGRFLIHGGAVEVKEGDWTGDLIVIEFPDLDRARAWYASPEYQAILPLRTGKATGEVVLLGGVPEGHRAMDVLADQPPTVLRKGSSSSSHQAIWATP